jgi:hypothetical protein
VPSYLIPNNNKVIYANMGNPAFPEHNSGNSEPNISSSFKQLENELKEADSAIEELKQVENVKENTVESEADNVVEELKKQIENTNENESVNEESHVEGEKKQDVEDIAEEMKRILGVDVFNSTISDVTVIQNKTNQLENLVNKIQNFGNSTLFITHNNTHNGTMAMQSSNVTKQFNHTINETLPQLNSNSSIKLEQPLLHMENHLNMTLTNKSDVTNSTKYNLHSIFTNNTKLLDNPIKHKVELPFEHQPTKNFLASAPPSNPPISKNLRSELPKLINLYPNQPNIANNLHAPKIIESVDEPICM